MGFRGPAALSSRTLPIIDISPYLHFPPDASARAKTAAAVDQACRNFGFFYLTGHGIPETLRQEMLRLARAFFALPAAEKGEIAISRSMDGVRGYEQLGQNVTMGKRDLLEGLDVYREPTVPSGEMLQGAQLWPARPATLKSTTLEYVERLLPVGKALMCAMADALGKQGSEEAFSKLIADPFWGLKFIRYPPLGTSPFDEGDEGVSLGEHTDYGGLTFLLADDNVKSALEVMDRDGGWIKADPVPGAYVVNIGDIVNVLTNNEYTATIHRVVHRGTVDRISIPFFFEPSLFCTVEPLQSCVSERGLQVSKSRVSYYQHMCHMLYNGRFVDLDLPVEKIIVNELSLKG